MHRLSLGLATYIGSMVLAAIVLLVYCLYTWKATPLPNDLLLPAVFTVLIAVATCYPVMISPRVKVSVATAALFAGLLLFGTPTAIVVAAIGNGLGNIALKRSWYNTLFNASQHAVCVGLSGLTYYSLVPQAIPFSTLWQQNIIAMPLAAAIMYLANTLAVSVAAGLQLRQDPLHLWLTDRRYDAAQHVALFLLGILAAWTARDYPWTIMLVIVPVAIVYLSFKNSLQLRLQTKEAMESLADVVDMRDPYTYAHSQRVAEYAAEIATAMGLSHEEIDLIRSAARVHDVGKIGVRSSILIKPGRLDPTEWAEMQKHPEIGADIVSKFPDFRLGKNFILHHHERYDGSGYPKQIPNSKIPLGARILAVADAFDAMTSDRPYRGALTPERAAFELQRHSSTQFDPQVVSALLKVLSIRPLLREPVVASQSLPAAS
ncbi:MAG: HD-GYP domain-containing protein [Chloroflexi bacterium]|nr:HD-GYP domain-containing protein [Chloroflexota bacterium]MCL5074684.1 HD-GYP domain-containing protein [Chloroflexota bacterium]